MITLCHSTITLPYLTFTIIFNGLYDHSELLRPPLPYLTFTNALTRFQISFQHASFSCSCDFLCHPFEIRILIHMDPVENWEPLSKARHTRPCLPFNLREHRRDPTYFCWSSIKENPVRTRCPSPFGSFLLQVVNHVREDLPVLVRIKAKADNIRPGHD